MISIKEYVKVRKEEIKAEISSCKVTPHLLIIQVNDDPSSNAYIKGKIKDAQEVGFIATLMKLAPTTTEEELLDIIGKANRDNSIHGIIVQMPLPNGINVKRIEEAIAINKDVDGFHPLSIFKPCTPKGIIDYLLANQVEITSKNAVVIGRSDIVGKPMAKLLLKENANVTVLHSKTKMEDMSFYIAHADIIVIAIGKKWFLDERFTYKKEAIVIDVGINRIDNHLFGDAKEDLPVWYKSPVPGGVGLLTRLTLLVNLLEAYKNGIQSN